MKRPSLTVVLTWVLTLATVAIVFLGAWWMANTIDDLREQINEKDAQVSEIVDQYSELYAQAESEGIEPSTQQPDAVAEDAEALRGATGATGAEGRQGPQGDMGEPGRQGPQGETGATGAPGATGPAGARGLAGSPGADGATGADGAQGAPGPGPTDAQVAAAVSAYCAARGECMGSPGAEGGQGAPGPSGPPGEPGPACPDGYSPAPVNVAAFDENGLPTTRSIIACVPSSE